jgi:recombination protein RecA
MAKGKVKKDYGDSKDKEKALELALLSLEKEFGKGVVIHGDSNAFPEIGRIPSGSISLDKALNGGYARGRIIELLGLESCGKTSYSLHAIAECQKLGGMAAFLDLENALDLHYASALGVDINRLLISQPECGEEALNIADRLTRSGAVDLIVVDSVAALVPRVELEGQVGDSSVGLQARMMSQAMRMLVGPAKKTNTAIIFINQLRSKIGVMYGPTDTTSGGNALKYYASQRLDIRRIETLQDGDDKTGIRSRIKVVKNKVGPPFKQTELNIMFGKGIDWAADLFDLAISNKLIERNGVWFSYNGSNIGQGTANACATIREKKELADELKQKLTEVILPSEVEEDIDEKDIE